MKLRYRMLSLLFAVALCLSVERRAYAYADAGTGLLVIQTVGAMFSGVLFFLRKHIRNGFSRKRLGR